MVIIKTLIELFDDCQIENVVSALGFKPEKIIFVGFKQAMSHKAKEDIRKFFEMKGLDIEIEYEIVGRYNFSEIEEKLLRLIDCNEDCCLDMTGGMEIVLAAMGAVAENRKVPLIQYDFKNREFVKMKNCQSLEEPEEPAVSIQESVVLNGGAIVAANDADEWKFTQDFVKDVYKAWEICSKNCGRWNRQISILGMIDAKGEVGGNMVKADLESIKNDKRSNYESKDLQMDKGVMEDLCEAGLLTEYKKDGSIVYLRYKNAQVHRLISKAGNILELYAYLTAKDISKRCGCFNDIAMGVFVDWDGVVYNHNERIANETRNEIDIMLTCGIVPVFVSCKNGEVKKEALYELDIMARRFGGEHAKKILLSTYVNSDSDGHKYITQRAKDMGIELIDNLHRMSHEEFAAEFMRKAK